MITYAPQAFAGKAHQGTHYVRYRDGTRSMLMSKRVARSYAKLFGGSVHNARQPNALVRAFRWGFR
jgi:hypothetical protein